VRDIVKSVVGLHGKSNTQRMDLQTVSESVMMERTKALEDLMTTASQLFTPSLLLAP
jgi:hypothetical protein